jgi:dTDP-4-dehydrorhamnose reductase
VSTVAVLGVNGMLGHTIFSELSGFEGNLIGSSRLEHANPLTGNHFFLDATSAVLPKALNELGPDDYVINCIGVINKNIVENSADSREIALLVNSLFPYKLDALASELGFKIIQIATDCVFSGSKGQYLETDMHDTIDIYGKTKSLGEVPSENMMNIRVSIIGPEVNSGLSLFEWVRNQPRNAQIRGYSDHFWNGVTTAAFARICLGIMKNSGFVSGTHHLIPSDSMSKFELVREISSKCERTDIDIHELPSGNRIDRTLSTVNASLNEQLWANAGYSSIPKIADLVSDIDL